MNYKYAEINIENINSWDDIIATDGIHVVKNVINISAKEYTTLVKNSLEEFGGNKLLKLSFIPNSSIDGYYKLIHFFATSTDGNSNQVYLKLIEQHSEKNINQSSRSKMKEDIFTNPGYNSKFAQKSPFNRQNGCMSNSLFSSCWSLMSLLGIFLFFTALFSIFNNNFEWINKLSGNCQDCSLNINKLWNDENEEIKKDSIISSKKTPFIYLDSLALKKSEFIDISLMWFSKNDLDLVMVSPNGELLWKDNPKTGFGNMDISMNDSKLDSLKSYSMTLSLKDAKTTAFEHLYIDKNISLKSGTYSLYVLNSDKRENCNLKDQYIIRYIQNNNIKYYKGELGNSLNNRCLGEKFFKQVYSQKSLEKNLQYDVAHLILDIEIN
jgi:hypothetical protein